MRLILPLNYGWDFTENFTGSFSEGKESECVCVDLPHTCSETPFHYFDESVYQMICGYRKKIKIPSSEKGKRVFLVVGAAGHSAQVYVNGSECGETHFGGYTEFTVELTDKITYDKPAWLAIRVDSRESQNIPPFGNVIDYMTYGGLYREVRLEIREREFIEDVFVRPSIPDNVFEKSGDIGLLSFHGTAEIDVTLNTSSGTIRQSVFDLSSDTQKAICTAEFKLGEKNRLIVPNARLWDITSPHLYVLRTELIKNDNAVDTVESRFGFRRAEFMADGFFLNGRRIKLIGLNRHQSFPYVGYAMPASMQRNDADILKNELGLNAVRTSHYPQSHHFIERCDELGLLVFTEIPGWQHIGDESWKDIAVRTTAEMVTQYRNHPSVILWGVRINESPDDDAFYERTNKTAHELDPTRQTGGVRCIKKSRLLEDVYTYNDFIHDGVQPGCESKKAVTSDMSKPYLVSEYGGHMYPTKPFDDEEHRLEHALRHARVLNDIAALEDIAGSFGWCFFDYNTHRDFGSGDRICYHGVCDMFRNPKLAAAVYSVHQDDTPILEVSSSMDIGEHPASVRGSIFVFTNADCVRFYKNDRFIKEYTFSDSRFKSLFRPPIEIDDFIGEQISDNENFSKRQAAYVKDILNESARCGISRLSMSSKLKAAWLMLRYGMKFQDAYALYGKYIENWGAKAVSYKFEAVRDGKVVKAVVKSPFTQLRLCVAADRTQLFEKETYDVGAVRITMKDANGCLLPFYNGTVKLTVSGDIRIIGPEETMLRGGCGGTYVRTVGKSGKASLTLASEGGDVTINYDIISERVNDND